MKKLLFGLIATVLFSVTGNAQEFTQEEVRQLLAQGMIDFKTSLKPAFEKSENAEEFKKIILGCWESKMTKEGSNLLDVAYKFLSEGASDDEILKNYNGKEMASAALYLDALSKKGIKTDGSELFGGTTGDLNPYARLFTSKCRWYQLRCILHEIFGDELGDTIVREIVNVLLSIIKML